MNAFQRKVALRVLGIHVAFILLLVIFSGLKGCFRRKPKPEIVTFIEFPQAAPSVEIEPVSELSEPDPIETPPEEPVKVPDPIPKPSKPKPEPKEKTPKRKVEPPKPKVEKPKWKPTKVDPTKSKVIKPTKKTPAIDPKKIDLSDVLEKKATPTSTQTSRPVGNPNADASYISQIGRFFDQRWIKPDSSAPAASAVVRVYISKWGTITRRTKIQGSGDNAFDASVMKAVNSVSKVEPPPSGFSYDYVEIEFRIRN